MKQHWFLSPLLMLALSCCLSLTPTLAGAASLTSVVDRNTMQLNETVNLFVELDQRADGSALDASILNADFDVLGISPRYDNSTTVVNGRATQRSSTKWVITLAPKREGLLTIPAFNIAGAQSSSITITVKRTLGQGDAQDLPLTASVKLSSADAFPNEELILTVELVAANNVGNLNGSQLAVENADLELISQDSFNRIRNGVAQQVVELKYILSPKQAGELVIPSLTFTGVQGGGRSLFGQRGKQVIARTPESTISVKEKPNSTNAWFPAANVIVRSDWSADTSKLSVGDPITRTITITARGQRAEAIPPIKTVGQQENSFSRYQDQPQLNTTKTAEGLVSTRIESEAIVPSKAGSFTLPAITVDWWDVNKEQWRKAILPAETLTAKPSLSTPDTQTPISSKNNQSQIANGSQQGLNQSAIYNQVWLWQAISALLMIVCVGQLWLSKSRTTDSKRQYPGESGDVNETKLWQALHMALKSGDTKNIARTLTPWVNAYQAGTTPITLASFINSTESLDLKTQLSHLTESLYGEKNNDKRHNGSLDTTTLTKLLQAERKVRLKFRKNSNNNRSDKHTLHSLYPH